MYPVCQHYIFATEIEAEDELTTVDTTEFLTKINLPQYAKSFKDISSEMLLESNPNFLTKLGITSPLHQMKIMQLLHREFKGSVAKHSTQHLCQFLKEIELDKYVSIFEQHEIDGDMMLEVDNKLMEAVLKEVGITSMLDIIKIRSKYRTKLI